MVIECDERVCVMGECIMGDCLMRECMIRYDMLDQGSQRGTGSYLHRW